ncbi:MAG: hypothetical protein ACKPKO_53000, partial [Candidatus Fonsibacter sp.]
PMAAVGTPATAHRLLERCVIGQGARERGYDWLLGRWAERAQCRVLVIRDPYLCSLRRSSEVYPVCDHLGDDALLHLLRDRDLELLNNTGLACVGEAVQAVDRASARLVAVRLCARGFLRDKLTAGGLLEAWQEGFRQRWGPRGVAVEVRVCPRLHRRQCILLATISGYFGWFGDSS